MTSLILKIILTPLCIVAADWLIPGVRFGNYSQAVLLGLILAVVGVVMEYVLLKRGTLWISTILDVVVSAVLIYFIARMLPGTVVTFGGALITGVILGAVEYFLHLWLIKSGMAKKAPV